MRLRIDAKDQAKILKKDMLEIGLINTSSYKGKNIKVSRVWEYLNRGKTSVRPWANPFLNLALKTPKFIQYALGDLLNKTKSTAGKLFANIFQGSIKPAPSIYGSNTEAWAKRKGFNRPLYHTGFMKRTTFGRQEFTQKSNFFR